MSWNKNWLQDQLGLISMKKWQSWDGEWMFWGRITGPKKEQSSTLRWLANPKTHNLFFPKNSENWHSTNCTPCKNRNSQLWGKDEKTNAWIFNTYKCWATRTAADNATSNSINKNSINKCAFSTRQFQVVFDFNFSIDLTQEIKI